MSWTATTAKVTLVAGAFLLLAGCGGREKVAIAAKDETIRRQESLIAENQAAMNAQRQASEAEAARAAQLNADLARQNDQMAQQNAKFAADNARETAELRNQVASLSELMKGINIAQAKPGEVGVQDGMPSNWKLDATGAIRITVASTVLFDSGDAALKTSSHSLLKGVATTIKQRFPNNYIRVEGHTDSVPVVRNKHKYADNMALSIARSRAVYDFLGREGGLSAGKMYTAGYGEHQPLIHPEKTASDRSKNRRVEIVIMPNDVKVTKEQLSYNGPKKK